MKVYVLAAGKGERLWPLSSLLPKCLFPIGGKPCVRWIVDAIYKSMQIPGWDITVCCLEKDEPLFLHEFRDTHVNISAAPTSLGTAGQLLVDPEFASQEMVMVQYGDCLVDVDYNDLVRSHMLKPSADAILVTTDNVNSPYGSVKFTDETASVESFEEKPRLGSTWTGVAVMQVDSVMPFMRQNTDFGYDVFPAMLRAGKKVRVYPTSLPYYDIGNVKSYKDVCNLAEQGRLFK